MKNRSLQIELENEEVLSPLANPRVTREVLQGFGLATKKSLGQNFLINNAIIEKILSLAEVKSSDAILEVGPGIGTLSIALLKRGGTLLSVERDQDLPQVLNHTLRPWADRFTLVQKDALNLRTEDLPFALNKFIANLPYAVAATLILDYFQRFSSLESATVMVQKEVAQRIAATPGNKNYGAYTVKLGLFTQVKGSFLVGPNNFFPPPHVDSTVIRLDRRKIAAPGGVLASAELLQATCVMADAAFASRRKTLSNSCKSYFASKGKRGVLALDNLAAIFEQAGVNPQRRGETLTQEEFLLLGSAYLDRCLQEEE